MPIQLRRQIERAVPSRLDVRDPDARGIALRFWWAYLYL
jgi:hypothetical protein